MKESYNQSIDGTNKKLNILASPESAYDSKNLTLNLSDLRKISNNKSTNELNNNNLNQDNRYLKNE